jgi:predicted Zn-ribbon and HTH transcriptional regulator
MITISLGNIGSGKTATIVREMKINHNERKTYSNIKTSLDNQIEIAPSMIIKKVVKGHKKNGDEIIEYKLNKEFWQEIKEPINVVIDEAHTIMNARRSMSKVNIIVSDWISMLRRVLGSSEAGYGELTIITQLLRRIDPITRDLATRVIYNVCHYQKTCKNCKLSWSEHSELPETLFRCPRCKSNEIKKHNHIIECWKFKNCGDYEMWQMFGMKNFYKHYFIYDIEKYFNYYDTLQWDNLFESFT